MRVKEHYKIKNNTKYVRSSNQTFSRIDDEIVLLRVDKSEYLNFNSIGADIWDLLSEPRSIEYLVSELVTSYEISPSQCRSDIEPFINELIKNHLIHIVND